MASPLITLLTDFGWRDPYVGAMKGVILSICPEAVIVDVSHDVPPFDVRHAAYVLRSVWSFYPPQTIHVAVVDPGVGSERKIVLARYGSQFVLAPDNGLITYVHRDFPLEAMVRVENPDYALPQRSDTFHGRDIFAPVAAHLAGGVGLTEFGPSIDRVETLPIKTPVVVRGASVTGCIVFQDRFENLITNIGRGDIESLGDDLTRLEVRIGTVSVGVIRRCYDEVSMNQVLALIGGSGYLEIAVSRGSAAQRFRPTDATEVRVTPTQPR